MGSASRLAIIKSFIQLLWGSFWCLVTGVSSFRTKKMGSLHHMVFYNTCWKWHLTQACKWEAVMQSLTLPWWRLNMTATQINMGTVISLQWISLTHGLLDLCDSISQRQKRKHPQCAEGRTGGERSTNNWGVRVKSSWNTWLRRKEPCNFVRTQVRKNTQGKAYNYIFGNGAIRRAINVTSIFSAGKNGREALRGGRRERH